MNMHGIVIVELFKMPKIILDALLRIVYKTVYAAFKKKVFVNNRNFIFLKHWFTLYILDLMWTKTIQKRKRFL